MTFNEWREAYSPHGMMNEAMARAAWDDSRKNTIDEISAILHRCGADLPINDGMSATEQGLSIALCFIEGLDK